ncbi:hypothetical protein [Actinomadura algeriensis]|uniref:Uncharacterized protein n=1 Tax=Actinomadura algeriensis TaxID=1679523 RepID=A0ABR9JNC7_9ACTN|nr:hypothetical protein [Actinomadura algeriensis]MBE1532055.1 hypothetical protein [Actinomadura algeriensis]
MLAAALLAALVPRPSGGGKRKRVAEPVEYRVTTIPPEVCEMPDEPGPRTAP